MLDLCQKPLWTKDLSHPCWGDLEIPDNPDRISVEMFHGKLNLKSWSPNSMKFKPPFVWARQFRGQDVLVNASPVGRSLNSRSEFIEKLPFLCVIWSNDVHWYEQLPFDEEVGISAPPYTTVVSSDHTNRRGTFWAPNPSFHRDRYPASIIVSDMTRSYSDPSRAQLTGLRAKHVIAKWYQEDHQQRWNGPSGIMLTDYQEFYDDGKLTGASCSAVVPPALEWTPRRVPSSVESAVNPLGLNYFSDPQDEMLWVIQELTSVA